MIYRSRSGHLALFLMVVLAGLFVDIGWAEDAPPASPELLPTPAQNPPALPDREEIRPADTTPSSRNGESNQATPAAEPVDADVAEPGPLQQIARHFKEGQQDLEVYGRLQMRYSIWEPGDNNHDVFGDQNEFEGFRLRQARLGIKGFISDINYTLELSLASEEKMADAVQPYEATVAYRPVSFWGCQLGLFKIPFSRQALISSQYLQLIEKSVLVEEFVPPSDVGFAMSGDIFSEGIIQYQVGLFNGANPDNGVGSPTAGDDNGKPLLAGRLVINPFGRLPLQESTLIPGFRLALEASAFENWGLTNDYTGLALAGEIRFSGFSLRSEYFLEKVSLDFHQVGNPDMIDNTKRSGFYVQSGYFLYRNYLELALRFESVENNEWQNEYDDIKHFTMGLNYFISGDHDIKAQLNYIRRVEAVDDFQNDSLIFQMQLAF
jgi:hypothetical protein